VEAVFAAQSLAAPGFSTALLDSSRRNRCGTQSGKEETDMLRYEPKTPRAALGAAAIALSTIVLGALVILPAEIGAYADESTPVLALTPAEAAARASDRSAQASTLRCTDVRSERPAAG
jgi:hypothetical protein